MTLLTLSAIVLGVPLALMFAAFLALLVQNIVTLIDRKIGLTLTMCCLLLMYVGLRILDQ
jgi:hypothetical protein